MISLQKLIVSAVAAGMLAVNAQQNPELGFAYRSATSPDPVNVNPNGRVQFPAAGIGAPSDLTFLITGRSSAPVTLVRSIISGAGFSGSTLTSTVLRAGETISLPLRFTPTSTGASLGELRLIVETGGRQNTLLFFLNGTALAPDVVYSYILNPAGNQLPLSNGGIVRFQPTMVGDAPTATIVVANRGTTRAIINSVEMTGEAFRVSGLPLMPFQLAAERELRFTVSFTPTDRVQYREVLRMDVDGSVLAAVLEGAGVAPLFSFQTISGSTVSEAPPGGPIAVPETASGSTSVVRIRVRNTGTIAGRINAIAVTGAAYQLTDVPPVPLTVPVGGSMDLVLNFTPKDPGPQPGRLRLDALSVELAGTGVGPRLQHSIISASGTSNIGSSGAFNFPNTSVGARATAELKIENTGNALAVINSIALTGTGFVITAPIELPIRLQPSESATVRMEFAPENVGPLTGTLQVDDQRFTLRGVAAAPAPIPAVEISIPETAQPLEQPGIRVRLAERYALPLTGQLSLAFTSESFADDPAIQFSSGGRTVQFRIPADSTDAIFADGSQQVHFQSGTVAGSIAVTAAFSVASVNVTPDPQPARNVRISQSEPRITALQVGNRTANLLELIITGFATSRSVTQLAFQFAAAPGAPLQTSTLTSDVEAAFNNWYSNAASRASGSQFVATVRINATGDLNGLQSVTVTAANGRGVSAPATVSLR